MITVINDSWLVKYDEQNDSVEVRENSFAPEVQVLITDTRRARGLIALIRAALELPGGQRME